MGGTGLIELLRSDRSAPPAAKIIISSQCLHHNEGDGSGAGRANRESTLKLREVEPPRMGRFDALMEVKACGVCGTDLSIVEGRFKPPRLPIVPGHEAIGRVLAVGEDASGW